MKISFVQLPLIGFFACEFIYPFLSYLTNTSFANLCCDLVVILLLILVSLDNFNKIKFTPCVIVFICLGLFYITGRMMPQYHDVMYSTYNIWDMVFSPRKGIIILVLISLINDPKEIFGALRISAIFVWLAYTLRSLSGVGLSELNGSNHAYGYGFLFVTIVYTIVFLKEHKLIYLSIIAVSFFQVILYASRTAFISYMVFWVLYLLFYENDKNLRLKKTLYVIGGFFLVLILTSNFFVNLFSDLVEEMGISSKIIDAFISGENQLDGGRERTYLLASTLLKENPWGLGVFWDRFYCEYGYVHNFFYEVMIDFGWLVGGTLLLVLVRNIILILKSDDKQWKILFMLFFSLSMIRLTLSYSFWYDTNFWAMIAILLGYRYSLKEKKKNEKIVQKGGKIRNVK